MLPSSPNWRINYMLMEWRLRRGSNPWPLAWQASVLTNWTTEPNSNQWEEISSSLPFSGMAAVIALIDFEKCVHLGLERLRVSSLIRPQLSGADSRTRTGTPIKALAPQASESTNSTISAYKWLIYVLMESPTTRAVIVVMAYCSYPCRCF